MIKKLTIQQFIMFIVLVVASTTLFINQYFINHDTISSVSSLGRIVTITWLLSLGIMLISGINEAASKLYFNFLVAFGLFHLGIPLAGFFSYSNDYFFTYINRWYFSDYTSNALISIFVFIIGYLLTYFTKSKGSVQLGFNRFEVQSIYGKFLIYGYIFLIVFWIIVVKFIFNVKNYTEYHLSNDGSILSFIYTYINGTIGFLFFVLNFIKKYTKINLYMFFLWAIFAFPLGLRGEVLFPLIISLPILIKIKFIKLNYTKSIAFVLIVLTLSSLVFITRNENSLKDQIDASPLATVAEMGGSLRPTYEVVKWLETKEMSYQYGATYWAPIERMLQKVIPLGQRIKANEDFRLMNVAIANKAGPYGFSIAAESKINFGWAGLFGFGILIGTIMNRADFQFDNEKFNLIFISFLYAIFFHIRQSFVGAFGTFIISLFICLLVVAINYSRKVQSNES